MNIQIFGFISIAVGIIVGIYFLWALNRQFATRKWIPTKGQILESRIQDNGSSLEPYVRYSYVVRGQTYHSDYISPNKYVYDQPVLESTINKILAPYPIGKTVKVYFSPQNPQDAVLKKHDSIFASFIIAFVSFMFIGIGIAMALGK